MARGQAKLNIKHNWRQPLVPNGQGKLFGALTLGV